MDHAETRTLLSAYIDGELATDRAADVERHLKDCAECRAFYDAERRMSAVIRNEGERFRAPAHLRARITSAIDRKSRSPLRDLRWLWVGWNPVAIAASLLLAVAMSVTATSAWLGGPHASEEAALTREVVAGQIRSLMADHLTDVASSDQHTVKPWFNGKLDFSPPVVDLTSQGFPLVGGRLDYLDHRQVAALVYRHQQHIINLFIWPEAGDEAPRTAALQGYNLVYFKQGGMEYWAVSDLNPGELRDFVAELMPATRAPA
ncbi:MAG TPA: anti-sigma factor [Stellaceae bacterium]|nr:anti-sigma factor [Stellaceae bacterium]